MMVTDNEAVANTYDVQKSSSNSRNVDGTMDIEAIFVSLTSGGQMSKSREVLDCIRTSRTGYR